MAKQLSQEEIDALLQVRTSTPGAESYDQETLESLIKADVEERVHPYNFKRPRLFAHLVLREQPGPFEVVGMNPLLDVRLDERLQRILVVRLRARCACAHLQ